MDSIRAKKACRIEAILHPVLRVHERNLPAASYPQGQTVGSVRVKLVRLTL